MDPKKHAIRFGAPSLSHVDTVVPEREERSSDVGGMMGPGIVLVRYSAMEAVLCCKHSHDDRVLWCSPSLRREVVRTDGADGHGESGIRYE